MTPRAREPICRRFMQNLWGQKKKVPPLQAGRGEVISLLPLVRRRWRHRLEPRRSAANEKREKSVWRPSLAGERRRKEEGGKKRSWERPTSLQQSSSRPNLQGEGRGSEDQEIGKYVGIFLSPPFFFLDGSKAYISLYSHASAAPLPHNRTHVRPLPASVVRTTYPSSASLV